MPLHSRRSPTPTTTSPSVSTKITTTCLTYSQMCVYRDAPVPRFRWLGYLRNLRQLQHWIFAVGRCDFMAAGQQHPGIPWRDGSRQQHCLHPGSPGCSVLHATGWRCLDRCLVVGCWTMVGNRKSLQKHWTILPL